MDWQAKMMSVNFSLFLLDVIFYSICFLKKMQWIVWFLNFVVLLPFISNIGSTRHSGSARAQRWSWIPRISWHERYCFCIYIKVLLFGCKFNDWDSYFSAHKYFLNSHSHHRQLGLLQIGPQYKWRRKNPPAPNPGDLKN